MSESINYTFNRGTASEFEYEISSHNLSLWMFVGELAVHNHAFIEIPVQRGAEQVEGGMYVFSDHKDYDNLKDIIERYNFPQHINLDEVPECDLDVWRRGHLADLIALDSFPEGWDSPS